MEIKFRQCTFDHVYRMLHSHVPSYFTCRHEFDQLFEAIPTTHERFFTSLFSNNEAKIQNKYMEKEYELEMFARKLSWLLGTRGFFVQCNVALMTLTLFDSKKQNILEIFQQAKKGNVTTVYYHEHILRYQQEQLFSRIWFRSANFYFSPKDRGFMLWNRRKYVFLVALRVRNGKEFHVLKFLCLFL